ncbi:MAG: ATP-binding cassette domain-containing protein [Chloroflexi bacterium]|nr:ATP-binding cassette domain-containing protein [Chloroflexota bacterium]
MSDLVPAVRLSRIVVEDNGMMLLRDFSLTVEEGGVVALLGPNGSGKSSLLRLLATLLLPKQGQAEVYGLDLRRQAAAVRRAVGFVPDVFGVYPGLKVREYLEFFAAIHKVRNSGATINDLVGLMELDHVVNQYLSTLPAGYRQRLALARALLHDPRLLLLDEPLQVVDTDTKDDVLVILQELRNLGKTIIIATHSVQDVASLITEVVVLSRGELLIQAPVTQLQQLMEGPRRMRLDVVNDPVVAYAALSADERVSQIQTNEQALVFLFDGDRYQVADLVTTLVRRHVQITQVREESTDLQLLQRAVIGHRERRQ